MRLTETMLRKIIREEVSKLVENFEDLEAETMPLNLTTIRNIQPATLTITKPTAIYQSGDGAPFLVSRSSIPGMGGYSTYGTKHNPAKHLNPGDQVGVIGILSAKEAGLADAQLVCMSPAGIEFRVSARDISRFLSL